MKKKKFIKSDNRGKTEKKIQYVLLFIMLLIGYFFVDYKVSSEKERKHLLETEQKAVVCQIIGRWHTRLSGNIFEYSVSGKTYKHHHKNNVKFKKGECYHGIFAKSKPEIVQIDLTSPIISNRGNFKEIFGKVQKTDTNSEPNSVLFTYRFFGSKYKRKVYVEKADIYNIGKSYLILVDERDPMVSYMKKQVKTLPNI